MAFDELLNELDAACMSALGETISYAADGVTFADVTAYVDYRDMVKALDVAEAIAQDITVTVLKSDVAAKPPRDARVTLARLPGKTFRPSSPRSDESGTHWEFDVIEVS